MIQRPAATNLPAALRGLHITQLCLLVPNLAEGVAIWSSLLGQAEWLVYTYGPSTVPDLRFRGEPGTYSMRLALAGSDPQLELIQPLDGPSIYHEWIDEHGYGTHHVGIHVPSAKPVLEALEAEGWSPVQSGTGYGLDGDGAFAYFDLVDELGLYLELIEVPARRRPSEQL